MSVNSNTGQYYSNRKNHKNRQYEEVGRNQVYLTEGEEIRLVNEYTIARQKLRMYILSKRKCRQWYLDLYRQTKAEGRSAMCSLQHQSKGTEYPTRNRDGS
jgi:hypothetical protein